MTNKSSPDWPGEKFWGGHPHFTHAGIIDTMEPLFDQTPDVDGYEVEKYQNKWRVHAYREPDLTEPDNVPEGKIWLPNINRRAALEGSYSGANKTVVDDAVKALIATVRPAAITGEQGRGVTITLARSGASFNIPFPGGKIGIYCEGRAKSAPYIPYWICDAKIYLDRLDLSHSEIIVAGGPARAVINIFLTTDVGKCFNPKMAPARNAQKTHMNWASVDLDAFILNLQGGIT